MDNTSSVNKNRTPNAKCCKDYKQKKKLNDASFGEKERLRANDYRAKKKENQSETENEITQPEKALTRLPVNFGSKL